MILAGLSQEPFVAASASLHPELGQVFVWGNAQERGTFHFIQKSEIKASPPPGDVLLTPCQPGFISVPNG